MHYSILSSFFKGSTCPCSHITISCCINKDFRLECDKSGFICHNDSVYCIICWHLNGCNPRKEKNLSSRISDHLIINLHQIFGIYVHPVQLLFSLMRHSFFWCLEYLFRQSPINDFLTIRKRTPCRNHPCSSHTTKLPHCLNQ